VTATFDPHKNCGEDAKAVQQKQAGQRAATRSQDPVASPFPRLQLIFFQG